MIKKHLNLDGFHVNRSLQEFAENVSPNIEFRNNIDIKIEIVTYWFFYFYCDLVTDLDKIALFIRNLVENQVQYRFIQMELETGNNSLHTVGSRVYGLEDCDYVLQCE